MTTEIEKTASSQKEAERADAIAALKESLNQGDTVYTILRRVSASGMTRYLDVYAIKNNQPHRLTWGAAKALKTTYDRKMESLKVRGCGAGISSIVSDLAWMLFGDECALHHRGL